MNPIISIPQLWMEQIISTWVQLFFSYAEMLSEIVQIQPQRALPHFWTGVRHHLARNYQKLGFQKESLFVSFWDTHVWNPCISFSVDSSGIILFKLQWVKKPFLSRRHRAKSEVYRTTYLNIFKCVIKYYIAFNWTYQRKWKADIELIG